MRKLPDPRRPSTGPDLALDEGSEDGAWLNFQRAGETEDSARDRSRVSREETVEDDLVHELELRLREWVDRVETLETEMGYLKRDLEVRIAYAREMERQVDEHTKAVRWAEKEMSAMRSNLLPRRRCHRASGGQAAGVGAPRTPLGWKGDRLAWPLTALRTREPRSVWEAPLPSGWCRTQPTRRTSCCTAPFAPVARVAFTSMSEPPLRIWAR